jgi:hypothetical protein
LCVHGDGSSGFRCWIGRAKKNRRASRRFLEILLRVCSVYALASPAAERCENQKYAKKRGVCMDAM